MATLWPWIVISCGIVGLFGYRFAASWQRWLDIAKAFFKPAVTGAERKDIEKNQSTLPRGKTRDARWQAPHRGWMPVVISLLVLLSALYIILSNNSFGDAQQKWAFGAVGTILGYWLKR